MIVLLSIKPEFAHQIFAGKKKFEYRRTIFRQPVTKIVVYASSPTKMVIGEFTVREVLFEDLKSLWRRTSQQSGISRKYFYLYFSDKSKGYAIRVGKITKYRKPKPLAKVYRIRAPQSFAYLKKQQASSALRSKRAGYRT
jgi:predicted transcriptional regulator